MQRRVRVRWACWAVGVPLLCVGTALHGQYAPARLDSVVHLLDPAAHDTAQLALLELAADSWFTSQQAYPYLDRLDRLSTELLSSADAHVRRRARRARGAFHYYTGYHAKFERNVPLALRSFKAALADLDAIGARAATGDVHDALGVLLRAAGDPVQAMASFQHELLIARERGDDHLITQALVHLAACHADLDKPGVAVAYLDSCPARSNADRSAVLNERARILELQGRDKDALDELEKSQAFASRTDNEWDELPVLTPMARSCYRLGDMRRGLRVSQQCADVAERMHDLTAECGCLVLAGEGLHALGDMNGAETALRKAMDLARITGNIGVSRELGDEGSLVEATGLLKDILAEQGRFREAQGMTRLWADLKDSVQRMNGRDEVMMFEFQREQLLDSVESAQRLASAQLLDEERIAQERYRRNIAALIGSVFAIVAIALWSRWRHTKRTNAAILRAQQRLLESERQREAEQVRTRIARDVHDAIGSDIAKIQMLGSEAVARMREDAAGAGEHVGRMRELAKEVRGSLNDIIWSVDPDRDTVMELVLHARAFIENTLAGVPAQRELDIGHEGADRPIDPATRRDLFLLLKEAVNNALKHSGGTRITVRFRTTADGFLLEVSDDGRGFDPAAVRRAGNGLRYMQARAAAMYARFNIGPGPGGGTLVRVQGAWPHQPMGVNA